MIQTIQPTQSPTPNPDPISYKRQYIHVYSYVNYNVINVPSSGGDNKVYNGRLYFTVKLLQDLFVSYGNTEPYDRTYSKHLNYLGFSTSIPEDTDANVPDIIPIYNQYHAVRMGFLKLFRFVLFTEKAQTVNNIWGMERKHTIAAAGHLSEQQAITAINNLNFFGPMQGHAGEYQVLAGSIQRIHVKK